MSAKVLIDAAQLREILSRHPDVEVELLRSAVPQVAELIRRKAVEKEPAIKQVIEDTFRRLMLEQGQKYGISDAMRAVVRIYLEDVWKASARELANEAAKAAALEVAREVVAPEIERAKRQIVLDEKTACERIDAYAREAAEREVIALLRAGKLHPAP